MRREEERVKKRGEKERRVEERGKRERKEVRAVQVQKYMQCVEYKRKGV